MDVDGNKLGTIAGFFSVFVLTSEEKAFKKRCCCSQFVLGFAQYQLGQQLTRSVLGNKSGRLFFFGGGDKKPQLGLCGTKVVWANTELKLRDDKKLVLPFKLKYISFMY